MVLLFQSLLQTPFLLLFLSKQWDRRSLQKMLLNLWSNLVYTEQACSWTGLSLGTSCVGNESANSFAEKKDPGSGQIINNPFQLTQ